MRILHVTPYYYPSIKYGGPVQSVLSLNKFLVKKGVDVDVYTTNAGIENGNYKYYTKWKLMDGVRIRYFSFIGYDRYNFSLNLFSALIKNISNYDLVHINMVWNFPVLCSALLCVIKDIPYIISPHGTLNKEAMEIKSYGKKKLYFKLIAQHYLKRASSIHFTTEDEKDNVLNNISLNNRNFVVPNGVDVNMFREVPEKGAFKKKYPVLINSKYILFIGRINYKKGLDLLARSFSELSNIYPNLYLVIAGPDDGYRVQLEKMLGDLNIIDKVIFTGLLKGEEILETYADAELFVLSSYSENFGMTVIEAMACGTPIIISDMVGIHREVKEFDAGIVIKNNVEDLFGSIRSLLDNKELRKRYSERGKSFVSRYYDIDKVSDIMINEYENILNSNKSN